MDRRTFVGTLAGALLVAPPYVGAQPRGKLLRVIGWLDQSWSSPGLSAFRRQLAKLGWIEGRNIAIVARSAENKRDGLGELAAELVALPVEVIVTSGTPASLAAKNATAQIPIVMTGTNDPVADGLVASLARPGGNVTGLTNNPGPSFYRKMVELLKEAAPRISRVAVLRNAVYESVEKNFVQIQAAASALNLSVVDVEVLAAEQMPGALAAAKRARVDALYVFPDYLNMSQTDVIAKFARNNRLPSISGARSFVQAGGLLSYWTDWTELRRRSANYVDKILRGANPSVLAVEQPDKFELLINIRTAGEIGITIPPRLRARADELVR
jgi:putative ABC transport system substrate-binding protein